ncbi:MAG: CRISPR-associated endonuclease Cas1 [Gammaproteobacteria bacterium]
MAGAELTLLLDRRDMRVRLDGRALRIERAGIAVARVPLGVLGSVIVHGSPLVSCDVWRALAERNVPAVLLPARGRGSAACLSTAFSNTIRLRRRQHRAASRPDLRLAVARRLVELKIRAQRQLLAQLSGRAGTAGAEPPTGLASSRAEVLSVFDRNLAAMAEVGNTAGLMGLEGATAAAWWGWLAAVLPKRWRFTARNRRPPRDPVNALLSLGYTLLGAEMLRQVHADGLDPALGFLHGIVPGRESLVLDLIEPLRPSIDAFILDLLDQVLVPRHFTFGREDGCRLNKDGRSLFYQAWAVRRGAWLDLWPSREGPTGGTPTVIPLDAEQAAARGPEEGPEPEDTASLPGQCRRIARMLRTLLDLMDLPEDAVDG